MLVSNDPIRRPVPHEQYPDDPTKEGEWIEFYVLPASATRRARETKAKSEQGKAASMLRELGPKFFKAMREGDTEERENLQRAVDEMQYHVDNYDRRELLKSIHAWSYTIKAPGDYDNPEDGLDERTALWAAEEAIRLTRPPTEEEEGES